jgi:hypothetical protein
VIDEMYVRAGLTEEQARRLQRALLSKALSELLKTGY